MEVWKIGFWRSTNFVEVNGKFWAPADPCGMWAFELKNKVIDARFEDGNWVVYVQFSHAIHCFVVLAWNMFGIISSNHVPRGIGYVWSEAPPESFIGLL